MQTEELIEIKNKRTDKNILYQKHIRVPTDGQKKKRE